MSHMSEDLPLLPPHLAFGILPVAMSEHEDKTSG